MGVMVLPASGQLQPALRYVAPAPSAKLLVVMLRFAPALAAKVLAIVVCLAPAPSVRVLAVLLCLAPAPPAKMLLHTGFAAVPRADVAVALAPGAAAPAVVVPTPHLFSFAGAASMLPFQAQRVTP
jgi:hypothetical protein